VIPEIDIWRVANLMLTRYGGEATAESAKRADELAAEGDPAGMATWLRVIIAAPIIERRSGAFEPAGPSAALAFNMHASDHVGVDFALRL
jgi:hypothetical protein